MDEVHKRVFRGCWCPPDLFEYVETGRLSIREAWLLLNIDSFVQHSARGCFASNEYLARLLDMSPTYMRGIIKKLCELGLLRREIHDNRRYLWTVWSVLGARKSCRGCTKIVQGGARKSCTRGLHREDYSLSRAATPHRDAPSVWKRMARKLSKAIGSVRKVNHNSNLQQWAKSFEMLHKRQKVDKSRIWKALNWYCAELPVRSGDPYFLVIHSGPSFREKFSRLELAMSREVPTAESSKVRGRCLETVEMDGGVPE